jgi:hypothetical protein
MSVFDQEQENSLHLQYVDTVRLNRKDQNVLFASRLFAGPGTKPNRQRYR